MTFTAEEAKAAFPDEVVTEAKTRLVKVPGLEKPVALITLDNGHDHTRPNTFGPQGLVSSTPRWTRRSRPIPPRSPSLASRSSSPSAPTSRASSP